MAKMLVSGLVLAGWLVTGVSMAASKADDCSQIFGQMPLNECYARQFSRADAELNAVWKKIQAKYADQPVFLEKLKTSQRLWVQFRDAEVQATFPVDSHEDPRVQYGSVYPMCESMLQTQLTLQRIQQLKVWLDGTDGGDACAGSLKDSKDLK